jgi:hypothetical protein
MRVRAGFGRIVAGVIVVLIGGKVCLGKGTMGKLM